LIGIRSFLHPRQIERQHQTGTSSHSHPPRKSQSVVFGQLLFISPACEASANMPQLSFVTLDVFGKCSSFPYLCEIAICC